MKMIARKIVIALSMAVIGLSIFSTTSCFFDGDSLNKGDIVLHIDFDRNNTNRIKTEDNYYVDIKEDVLFKKWTNNSIRPSGVLSDNHGNVCNITQTSNKDITVYTEVDIRNDSTLTFEFKSDSFKKTNEPGVLQVIIINNRLSKPIKYYISHNGKGDGWCKSSIPLEYGKNTIVWVAPKRDSYAGSKSMILLDNITVATNVIDSVEIYPKGLQETYVGGDSLQFYVVPKRKDGSVILKEKIRYSASGSGYIDDKGIFTPTKEGKCTITAKVGDVTVSKKDIYVHGKDYLSESVNIGNYTFTGKVELKPQIMSDRASTSLDTYNVKYDYPSPMSVNFNADGFFVLKGTTRTPLYIEVTKNKAINDSTPLLSTYYLVRKPGDFYKRIWLRFGEGNYTIKIVEDNHMKFTYPPVSEYIGDFDGLSTNIASKVLNVTNTSKISEEEAKWLLPSEYVQSDSFTISNLANFILADMDEYNNREGDIIKAIHNIVIHSLYTDLDSLRNPNKRKAIDAISVLKYQMGTPDGYSNLFAALTRKLGIKTQIIKGKVSKYDINASMVHDTIHVWTNVYYQGRWYLVDTSLDDPFPHQNNSNYSDKNPKSEDYTYFMTEARYSGYNNIGQDLNRSITSTSLSTNLY